MSKRRGIVWRILRTLLIVYVVLTAGAWLLAGRLLFFPPPPRYGAGTAGLTTLTTSSGETIAVLYYPAKGDRPTLLYSHGNAEDIGDSLPLYESWQERGWGVLAYDYPGYGRSSGSPSEASTLRAIETAWDFLTDSEGLAPEEIVLVGRSIGSGPSVWLSAREKPRALVLFSPFRSIYALRPPLDRLIAGNRYPNEARLRGTSVPLLVFHGDQDELIPPSHGRQLIEASAAETKRFVNLAGRGHNDLFIGTLVLINEKIAEFIDRSRPHPTGPPTRPPQADR